MADAEGFQVSETVVGCSETPFDGDASRGGSGARGIVEKLPMDDHPLYPMEFLARTRKKYVELRARLPTCCVVSARVESLNINVVNEEPADTWRWYVIALNGFVHRKVTVVGWLMDPSGGETGTGEASAPAVLKVRVAPTEDPALLVAKTEK